MVDYVCISYDRADSIKKKTLSMLLENNIPKDKIYIVVASKAQQALYKQSIDDDAIKIIVGVKGIVQVRDWVRRKWNGKKIVMMDDDIRHIYKYKKIPNKSYGKYTIITNFSKWVDIVFELLNKYGGRLGGFTSNLNGLNGSTNIVMGLVSFTRCWCEVCDKKIQLTNPARALFEDVWLSYMYYKKYGNNILVKGISSGKEETMKNEGGLMSDYTLTERQKHLYRESKLLYDKYPEYHSSVKVIDNKKDLGGSYYKGRIKSSLREVIGHS